MTSPAIRNIGRNTGYLIGTQGVTIISRLVWVVIAARILGPDLYALLAYCLTWQLAFLPLALFGVGPALSYLIGPDRTRAKDYAGHVLAIRLVTIVIATTACVGLSEVFTPDSRAPLIIAILSLVLAAKALTVFTHTVFTAFEVNQYTMRQETLFGIIDLLAALAILVGGGSLIMLVTAKAGIAWLQTIWSLSLVHRKVFALHLEWRPAQWRPLLKLAVPALLITLAADWRFNGSLVLFRNLTTDGILFGQYALAMQALMILTIAPLALSRAVFPALRRSVSRSDGREAQFAALIQKAAPLAGTAAGLLGLAIGEPLVSWLLGEPFRTAGVLVGLTFWCLIPLTAAVGYPEIMIAHGRFNTMVFLHVIGALVMTALTFLFVPSLGVAGAIAAALIGFCIVPAGAFIIALRQQEADLNTEIMRPFAAAILGGGVYLMLSSVSAWLALPAGLVTLVIAVWLLRVFSPEDIMALRGRQ